MADKIRDNPKSFDVLNQRLAALDAVQSKAGWFETARYPDGRPVAAVAAGNELGIPGRNIPPRPFMRPAEDKNGKAWGELGLTVSKRVLAGTMSAHDAMDAVAQRAVGDIKKAIVAVTAPPLSPITLGARKYRSEGKTVTGATIGEIARKLDEGTLDISGVSDKPLVDSAIMINSATHITESKK